jgi:hypothetical protein
MNFSCRLVKPPSIIGNHRRRLVEGLDTGERSKTAGVAYDLVHTAENRPPQPNRRSALSRVLIGDSLFWGAGVKMAIMNTKQRGDIAEQAAVLEALKRGWSVLRPVGDNLPYDLVVDIGNRFVKVQVKCAWLDGPSQNFVVDNRRTKTNRRQMIREEYKPTDFDFALVYLPEKAVFYVYPVQVFISFGSEIHMVEAEKRQRKPKSFAYRAAWDLITPDAPRTASMADEEVSSAQNYNL